MEEEGSPPSTVCTSCSSDSKISPDKSPCLEDKQSGGPVETEVICAAETTPVHHPGSGSVSTVPGAFPPETPIQSAASPKPCSSTPQSPTSPRTSGQLNPSGFKTPQMMVLGKDGSDYRDLMLSRSKQQHERQQALLEGEEKVSEGFEDEATGSPEVASSSWWNRLWHGKGNHNSLPADDEYTSMDHEEQQQHPDRRVARRPQQNDVESQVYYQGLNEDRLRSPPPARLNHQSMLRNLPLPSTREEQIQQDCSFLYRPVDENFGMTSPKRTRRTLRAILDPPPAGVSTLYQDAQEVWSPPVMAQYMAKYQQLNEPYEIQDKRDRFADYNDYAVTPTSQELTLEEQEQQSAHRALVAATVATSSLFFQHEANGRVVLRLPRDHVRLMVANPGDMEPGILSVIQNRREDEPTAPKLEYCLTVPSNLYQKVVSEMTQFSHASHGLDSSFHASDHADIRWAIGILTVMMIILGINTLVFGLN